MPRESLCFLWDSVCSKRNSCWNTDNGTDEDCRGECRRNIYRTIYQGLQDCKGAKRFETKRRILESMSKVKEFVLEKVCSCASTETKPELFSILCRIWNDTMGCKVFGPGFYWDRIESRVYPFDSGKIATATT